MSKKAVILTMGFSGLVIVLFAISFSAFHADLKAIGEELSPHIVEIITKAGTELAYRLWLVVAIFIGFVIVVYVSRKNVLVTEHKRYKSILEDGKKEAQLLKKRSEIDLTTAVSLAPT